MEAWNIWQWKEFYKALQYYEEHLKYTEQDLLQIQLASISYDVLKIIINHQDN